MAEVKTGVASPAETVGGLLYGSLRGAFEEHVELVNIVPVPSREEHEFYMAFGGEPAGDPYASYSQLYLDDEEGGRLWYLRHRQSTSSGLETYELWDRKEYAVAIPDWEKPGVRRRPVRYFNWLQKIITVRSNAPEVPYRYLDSREWALNPGEDDAMAVDVCESLKAVLTAEQLAFEAVPGNVTPEEAEKIAASVKQAIPITEAEYYEELHVPFWKTSGRKVPKEPFIIEDLPDLD